MAKFQVRQRQWVGAICPPPLGRDRVNVSENLGKAAALPALPQITPLGWSRVNISVKTEDQLIRAGTTDRVYCENLTLQAVIAQNNSVDPTKVSSFMRKVICISDLNSCHLTQIIETILKLSDVLETPEFFKHPLLFSKCLYKNSTVM